MAKILNFGSLNIDYVYHVEHFVTPGETVTSLARDTNCGGKGLNQSIAASLAGARVYHAGSVGADGGMLKEMLEAKGVDTRLITTAEGPSGHAVIQVDRNGQNSILLFPGANAKITDRQIEETLAGFGKGDYLILQNEISKIPEIMRAAGRKGMKIVFNPSPVTPDLMQYPLELVSLFVLNEIEGAILSGKEDVSDVLTALEEKFPKAKILLTLGTRGAVYSSRGKRIPYGIHKAPVADTTAAGDTMLGFFTGLLAKGKRADKALELATKASAITVSGKGAAPSIPTLEQAENCPFPYAEYQGTY